MIVAAGLPVSAPLVGSTIRAAGAAPKLHCIIAPAQICMPIQSASPLLARRLRIGDRHALLVANPFLHLALLVVANGLAVQLVVPVLRRLADAAVGTVFEPRALERAADVGCLSHHAPFLVEEDRLAVELSILVVETHPRPACVVHRRRAVQHGGVKRRFPRHRSARPEEHGRAFEPPVLEGGLHDRRAVRIALHVGAMQEAVLHVERRPHRAVLVGIDPFGRVALGHQLIFTSAPLSTRIAPASTLAVAPDFTFSAAPPSCSRLMPALIVMFWLDSVVIEPVDFWFNAPVAVTLTSA